MEIAWSIRIITDTIGVVPRYFRPPFGEMNANGLKVLGAYGLTSVTWNQDSQDWATFTNATQSAAAVQAVNGWVPTLKFGNILSLEHDLQPQEVQMGLQIGQIAIKSGAVLSPVGTCLHDVNWYQPLISATSTASAGPTTSPAPPVIAKPNAQSSSESIAILTILFISLLSILALF